MWIRISDPRSVSIMLHQRNQMNKSTGHGFISSIDEPWSEWSWISDPDPDHPRGTRFWTPDPAQSWFQSWVWSIECVLRKYTCLQKQLLLSTQVHRWIMDQYPVQGPVSQRPWKLFGAQKPWYWEVYICLKFPVQNGTYVYIKNGWINQLCYHKVWDFALAFREMFQNLQGIYGIASTLGSRVDAVVRVLAFHQCVPDSILGPGVMCGLSLLVLYSALLYYYNSWKTVEFNIVKFFPGFWKLLESYSW